jgi:hypothetical protein
MRQKKYKVMKKIGRRLRGTKTVYKETKIFWELKGKRRKKSI